MIATPISSDTSWWSGRYHDVMSTAQDWLNAFAVRLGVDAPSEAQIAGILDLAACAAHSSERTAAPVACWLAAHAGLTPDQALEIARSVQVEDS